MNPKIYKTRPEAGQDAYSPCGENHVFLVPDSPGKPVRIDAFLGDVLGGSGFSREKIKQAIRSGLVTRNGEVCAKPGARLFPGDRVVAALVPLTDAPRAEPGDIRVLWRDEHLAVLDKPAGLTVHPAPGRESGTLVHRLLHHFPELAAQDGPRPGIVHRLDKDTSGLMLVAFTEKARHAMSGAFAARDVSKDYLALVHGTPAPASGVIADPIGRDPARKTRMAVLPACAGGKEAHSEYATLHADPKNRFSLLRVAIRTGRTHQIRVHMHHIGHPLVGDAVYKKPGRAPLPGTQPARQMLHAWKLAFTHPVTGAALAFTAPPPDDFSSLAVSLATPMQRVIITGSPGGGKSTLARALHDAGVPVWSADESVKRLYEKDADGWYMLLRRYGRRFVPDDAAGVDKAALFAAMREDAALRREVEAVIHPMVEHDLERFWNTHEGAGAPLAAAEIPLALETGRRGVPGRKIIVAVYCPFAKRRARMAATRGWSDETIRSMESWQWPEAEKIRGADLVVDNAGSVEDLLRRARALPGVLAFLREQTRRRIRARFTAMWLSR